jgi:hypothetical protein
MRAQAHSDLISKTCLSAAGSQHFSDRDGRVISNLKKESRMPTMTDTQKSYNGSMANPNPQRGEVWKAARKIFVEHPFLSPADIAKVLKVSSARIYKIVEDKSLWDEREKAQKKALDQLTKEYEYVQKKEFERLKARFLK